jgi:hypothetical protein
LSSGGLQDVFAEVIAIELEELEIPFNDASLSSVQTKNVLRRKESVNLSVTLTR